MKRKTLSQLVVPTLLITGLALTLSGCSAKSISRAGDREHLRNGKNVVCKIYERGTERQYEIGYSTNYSEQTMERKVRREVPGVAFVNCVKYD